MSRNVWRMACLLLVLLVSSEASKQEPNITLDFFEAEVTSVYYYIGEITGYNMVIHPSVTGTITVKLTDVPWRKALEVVLETMGHEARIDVNTIFIAPMGKLR